MNPKSLLFALCLFCTATGWIATAEAAPLQITGPEGVEVLIDGRPIGFLPLDGPLDLQPGEYELRCELPGHQPYESKVKLLADGDGKWIEVRLMPLKRRTALLGNVLFAGLGQHYTGQNLRGWAYNALEVGGLLTAVAGELSRSNHRKDYLLLMEQYGLQINPDQAANYRSQAMASYADMEDAETLRDTGLWITGGAILLSLLDTMTLFPGIEAGVGQPPQWSNLDRGGSPDPSLHLGWKTRF